MPSLPEPVIAVDIGGTTTRVALVKRDQVEHRHEFPTDSSRGLNDLLDRLTTHLHTLPVPASLPLAVSCTGRVTHGTVTAINQTTMPGWQAVPLRELLHHRTGRDVHIINDAKAATLAEWTYGHGRTKQHFLFVTISTGVGSGLILHGQLHDSPRSLDSGLGFTSSDHTGPVLEHVTSGTALGERARQFGFTSAARLFDAAEANHTGARGILDIPLQLLALRISDLHRNLGLDHVTLGGSVGLRPYTLDTVARHLDARDALPVTRAILGHDAGLIGAAIALTTRTPQKEPWS